MDLESTTVDVKMQLAYGNDRRLLGRRARDNLELR
jgi:hypothetical protein